MQRGRLRQAPQDDDKGEKGNDRTQQADADVECALDEQLDVVGHALVRVVGGVALQLHAVVIGVMQPFAEIFDGHPFAPADLEPLVEVELVDCKHDGGGRERDEEEDLADEAVPVLLLQRIVEAVAPLVEQHVIADQQKLDGDRPRREGRARPTCPRNGNRALRCARRSRASRECCSQIKVSRRARPKP